MEAHTTDPCKFVGESPKLFPGEIGCDTGYPGSSNEEIHAKGKPPPTERIEHWSGQITQNIAVMARIEHVGRAGIAEICSHPEGSEEVSSNVGIQTIHSDSACGGEVHADIAVAKSAFDERPDSSRWWILSLRDRGKQKEAGSDLSQSPHKDQSRSLQLKVHRQNSVMTVVMYPSVSKDVPFWVSAFHSGNEKTSADG